MAQVILVRGTFQEQFKIESFFRTELLIDLIVKDSIKDALQMLSFLPDIDAICLPEQDLSGTSALIEIESFSKKDPINTSILITTKDKQKYIESVTLDFLPKKIIQLNISLPIDLIKNEIKNLTSRKIEKIEKQYFSVPFSIIFNTLAVIKNESFPFDLSFGIRNEDDTFQYILRFRKNEKIIQTDLEKYKLQKNGDRFYISNIDKDNYHNFFESIRKKHMLSNQDTFQQKIFSAELTMKHLASQFASFRIDEEGTALVQDYMFQSLRILKDKNAFTALIKSFLEKTTSFQFVHSMLIAIVLNKVGGKLGWDSPSFKEKIAYISVMHDLCLTEDELSLIENESQLKNKNFSEEQIQMTMNHAYKIATMVSNFKDTILGVDEVLREHHGMKNGIGFSKELNLHLNHLSVAFITVEYFVHRILELQNPTKNEIKKIISDMEIIFNKGFYSKVVDALRVLFS